MKRYLILTLLLAGFIGCDFAGDNGTASVSHPFAEGNYWIYNTTTYDDDGNILSSSEDSVGVISVKTIGCCIEVTLSNGKILRIDKSGVWDDCFPLHKFFASCNDTLFGSTPVHMKFGDSVAPGTITVVLDGVNIPVNTSAGTFTANRNKWRSANAKDLSMWQILKYYSPTVGPLKDELYEAKEFDSPMLLTSVVELIRYHVK